MFECMEVAVSIYEYEVGPSNFKNILGYKKSYLVIEGRLEDDPLHQREIHKWIAALESARKGR